MVCCSHSRCPIPKVFEVPYLSMIQNTGSPLVGIMSFAASPKLYGAFYIYTFTLGRVIEGELQKHQQGLLHTFPGGQNIS